MGGRGDGSLGGWVEGWMAGRMVVGEGWAHGYPGSRCKKDACGLIDSRQWERKSHPQADNKNSSHW